MRSLTLCLIRDDTVWSCISKACKDVMRDSKVSKDAVKGIGFDGEYLEAEKVRSQLTL